MSDRWLDATLDVPSLLPLQAAPEEEGAIMPYLKSLHNYLKDDRVKIARALSVISYYRQLMGDGDDKAEPKGTQTLYVEEDTRRVVYDSKDAADADSPEWRGIVAANVDWTEYTSDPTGFAVPEAGVSGSADIGISGGNFFIEPYDTTFRTYFRGMSKDHTAQETISLAPCNAEGNWFIYYAVDADNNYTLTLNDSVTFEDVIRDNIFICELYHDGNSIQFGVRETHGLMPWSVHLLWHSTLQTSYRSGLGLANMVVDGNGNTDSHAEVDAATGTIVDEDIAHTLATMNANWDILYKENGGWVFESTGANSPVKLDGGAPQWNDVSVGGSETLTTVTSNKYYLLHVLATGIEFDGSGTAANGHVAIIGQAEYNSVADARVGATEEANTLDTTGLPMPEFIFVGSIIAQRKGSNAYNTAFRSTDEGDDYVSWLGSSLQPGSGPGSHPDLTNRDLASQHPATAISTDTTNFDGILSSSDDEVQAALDTIDDHAHSAVFADGEFAVYNTADNTKIVDLDVSGVTTGETRTLAVPDASGTIALEDAVILADGSNPLTSNWEVGPANIALDNTYSFSLYDNAGAIAYNLARMQTTDQIEVGTVSVPIEIYGNPVKIGGAFNGSDHVRIDTDGHTTMRNWVRMDHDADLQFRRYLSTKDFRYGASNVGAFLIRPFGAAAALASTMFHIKISGYTWDSTGGAQVSGAIEVLLGGYARTTPDWTGAGASAVITGAAPITQVRLSRDASGYHTIVLGATTTTWKYWAGTIDIMSMFTGGDDFDPDDITLAFDASLTSFTHDVDMTGL